MSKAGCYIEKYLCIGLILLISFTGLSACSQSTSTPFQNSTPIKIGTSISTTGDFSTDGKALQQGYQLWQDTLNKSGGLLGRPVLFDFLSDDSTPVKVADNYQKMMTMNRDDLIVGPFSTTLTITASLVAQRYNYAFVEGIGTAPKVFTQSLNTLFSVSLPATSYLKSFVYYILSLPQAQRPKTVAYVSNDDFFTQPQIDASKALLEAGGVRTVLYTIYSADTTNDYTPFANKIISAQPDVVILGTNGPQDCIPYMKIFKQQHFNPRAIIATAGPDQGNQFTKPLGGPMSAEGIFVPNNGWFPTVTNYQNSQFIKDYIDKYGGSLDGISADSVEGYSVGQVLAQAVTKIHSINNIRLIQELHSDTFNTLQGPAKFANDGENSVAVAFLFQWQNGKLIVVYPNSAAQENPEFPKQSWS